VLAAALLNCARGEVTTQPDAPSSAVSRKRGAKAPKAVTERIFDFHN
jgi:hypothetical protein